MNRDTTLVLLLAGGMALAYFLVVQPTVALPPPPPPPPPPEHGKKGDLNDDGFVGLLDLELLILYVAGRWTSSILSEQELFWRADINDDGVVDDEDIAALWEALGGGAPPPPPTELPVQIDRVEVRYSA